MPPGRDIVLVKLRQLQIHYVPRHEWLRLLPSDAIGQILERLIWFLVGIRLSIAER